MDIESAMYVYTIRKFVYSNDAFQKDIQHTNSIQCLHCIFIHLMQFELLIMITNDLFSHIKSNK